MSKKQTNEYEIECCLPWKANVGESPVWHAEEQRLYWVDILDKKIHRFDPEKRFNESFVMPDIVPCIALRERGGLILTLSNCFASFDPESKTLARFTQIASNDPEVRFNDGKCDPAGCFWAGTMGSDHWDQPVGKLFRFDAEHRVQVMQDQVVCSNGTGWSPDGKTMYYTESFRYEIFAYDFDLAAGVVSERRSFVKIDKNLGFPDGLTVDSEGCVWSNIVGPGRIHRYDPQGKLERVVQFPVPRATACTFGGADLKTLYVTSSYETLTEAQLRAAPLSGSLFALRTEITGLPSTPYRETSVLNVS